MQTQAPSSGIATLTHWGVIRAQGADAAMFLHAQLTHDFSQLGLSQARLAAFCSAKGRMQASFVAWKTSPDEVLLACSASVLPATLKRLSMFVLRAKCKLSDATAEVPLHGAIGDSASALLGGVKPWARRWDKHEADGRTIVRLPDALGLPRALFVGESEDAPSLSLDAWRWLEVHSGVPTIEAATVDQFVPQMLNFELIDGVDFKKGCYPGQEVVARSQYRGTIKRRMFVFDIDDGLAAAGQEVFDPADPGQPAGLVVQAAPAPGAAGSSALVEVKLAALQPGRTLHLGAPGGALLRRAALPYDVPFEATDPG